MITIKRNTAPNMTVCKMNCDNGLHPKLNEYELTSFMNSHTTNLLIGKPRSGKTSLLYSFFKSSKLFKKTYHNIFIFHYAFSFPLLFVGCTIVSNKDRNLPGLLPPSSPRVQTIFPHTSPQRIKLPRSNILLVIP